MLERYNDQRWAVGVSGGPDSMALLDMLLEAGVPLVVVHVNYHIRESANRDQKIVEDYCIAHHLNLYVREVKEKHESGFEAWARDYRYDFYKEVVKKENLAGVMLAHHKDDFLETAILRVRQNRQSFLGIRSSGMVQGLMVVRPLLNMYKDDLIKYVEMKGIAYGLDETNDDLHYTRNAIRYELNNWTTKQKNEAYISYQKQNMAFILKEAQIKMLYTHLVTNDELNLELLANIQEKQEILRLYLTSIDEEMFELSQAFYNDLEMFIASDKAHLKEVKDYVLVKEDGKLHYYRQQNFDYEYLLEERKPLETSRFKVCLVGEYPPQAGLGVNDEEFPLRIRNVRAGDEIEFAFGHRNIRKMLRAKKFKYEEIQSWPVIENKDHKVIFVVGIGADSTHFANKHNLFVVK